MDGMSADEAARGSDGLLGRAAVRQGFADGASGDAPWMPGQSLSLGATWPKR